MDIQKELIMNCIINNMRWSYYYDPWIEVSDYNDNLILSIFLLYLVQIFILRQFLNGMYMHFLTKRQCQKKMRKLTLKERFTYSRCRDEIPTGWIYFYWFIIIIYPIIMTAVMIIQTVYATDPFVEYILQIFEKAILYISGLRSAIILVLFYSKGNSFAYDRWLVDPKTRKERREAKQKQRELKKRRREGQHKSR